MREPRLIMLPGLGCDARMLRPQRRAFGRVEVPPWLDPEPRESLAHYAERMASLIDTSHPYYLGGISMGGMVALEMARHLRPQAVFLVGSARSGSGVVDPLIRAERFQPYVKPWMLEWFKPLSPLLVKGLPRNLKEQMVTMFEDTDPRFVKWGCSAIVHWPGEPRVEPPVFQIHGERDWLLPVNKERPDYVIPRAGHLINLTHAGEVNAYLRRKIEEVEGR